MVDRNIGLEFSKRGTDRLKKDYQKETAPWVLQQPFAEVAYIHAAVMLAQAAFLSTLFLAVATTQFVAREIVFRQTC